MFLLKCTVAATDRETKRNLSHTHDRYDTRRVVNRVSACYRRIIHGSTVGKVVCGKKKILIKITRKRYVSRFVRNLVGEKKLQKDENPIQVSANRLPGKRKKKESIAVGVVCRSLFWKVQFNAQYVKFESSNTSSLGGKKTVVSELSDPNGDNNKSKISKFYVRLENSRRFEIFVRTRIRHDTI